MDPAPADGVSVSNPLTPFDDLLIDADPAVRDAIHMQLANLQRQTCTLQHFQHVADDLSFALGQVRRQEKFSVDQAAESTAASTRRQPVLSPSSPSLDLPDAQAELSQQDLNGQESWYAEPAFRPDRSIKRPWPYFALFNGWSPGAVDAISDDSVAILESYRKLSLRGGNPRRMIRFNGGWENVLVDTLGVSCSLHISPWSSPTTEFSGDSMACVSVGASPRIPRQR